MTDTEALLKLRKAIERAGGDDAVAARLGTTRSHLYNVTTGKRPMGRETARRLHQVLRVNDRVWVWLLLESGIGEGVAT